MESRSKKDIIKKIMPEVFLKKVLSYPYEHIGNSRVFYITDILDTEQLYQSKQVVVCSSIDILKQHLEQQEKINLYVSQNLVNRTLLEKLLKESPQNKNIFLGND